MQHHDVNLYNSSPPQASQATVFSWSPIGCPLMLLTATGDGQICAWSPSGTVDTHWTPCVVLIAAKPIGMLGLHNIPAYLAHLCYSTPNNVTVYRYSSCKPLNFLYSLIAKLSMMYYATQDQ